MTESETNGTTAAPAAEAPSDLEAKIIKQVEFYFGDINLAKDNFLKEQIKLDEGWVTMETMLKFKRLVQLSESADAIVTALRKSTTGLMEVSEDGSKIRRSPEKPLPENTKDRAEDLRMRSIYAKGFAAEASLDEIQEWFEQNHGPMEYIQMRRLRDKSTFKGSVFAVFKSQEDAKKFIEAEEVKYSETPLLKRLLKHEYFKMKEEEMKKNKEESQAKKEEAKKNREENEEKEFKARMKAGAILCLAGLPEGLSIEDLKETFNDLCPVAWVDFQRNEPEGKIRFADENGAKEALDKLKEKNDGKAMIKDTEITTKILEGEEEEKYWKGVIEAQRNKGMGRGRGRGGHRGGRGGKRGFRGRGGGGPAKRAKHD